MADPGRPGENVNAERLYRDLQTVVRTPTGRGCNLLILDAGEVYVQFRWQEPDPGVICCEAVSNTYLSPAGRLDDWAILSLTRLGFESPGQAVTPETVLLPVTTGAIRRGGPDSSPNFFRFFAVDSPDAIRAVVCTTLAVFNTVYGISLDRSLDFTLTLGDGCKPPAVGGGPKH